MSLISTTTWLVVGEKQTLGQVMHHMKKKYLTERVAFDAEQSTFVDISLDRFAIL